MTMDAKKDGYYFKTLGIPLSTLNQMPLEPGTGCIR